VYPHLHTKYSKCRAYQHQGEVVYFGAMNTLEEAVKRWKQVDTNENPIGDDAHHANNGQVKMAHDKQVQPHRSAHIARSKSLVGHGVTSFDPKRTR
jgi:hypothetical protein